jgi:phage-related protein
MPAIGAQCHELRITDRGQTWRIMYHVAADAVVILDVFNKKTEATPKSVLDTCRTRLAVYRTVTSAKERR